VENEVKKCYKSEGSTINRTQRKLQKGREGGGGEWKKRGGVKLGVKDQVGKISKEKRTRRQ